MYIKTLYMFSRKHRFLRQETKKIGFAFFWFFYNFLRIFEVAGKTLKTHLQGGPRSIFSKLHKGLWFYKNLPAKISILATCPCRHRAHRRRPEQGRRCAGERPARPRGPTRCLWWGFLRRSRRRRPPATAHRDRIRRQPLSRCCRRQCIAEMDGSEAGRLEEGGKQLRRRRTRAETS
jgi:hypothetical protein